MAIEASFIHYKALFQMPRSCTTAPFPTVPVCIASLPPHSSLSCYTIPLTPSSPPFPNPRTPPYLPSPPQPPSPTQSPYTPHHHAPNRSSSPIPSSELQASIEHARSNGLREVHQSVDIDAKNDLRKLLGEKESAGPDGRVGSERDYTSYQRRVGGRVPCRRR